MKTIYVYGTDKRQHYLYRLLMSHGYHVIKPPTDMVSINELSCSECTPMTNITGRQSCQDIILLPVPVTRNILDSLSPFISPGSYIISGNLPDDFIDTLKTADAHLFNYMKIPAIGVRNAVATSEGAIMEAMADSSITIYDSRCLVIGYGKCGSILADRLQSLHAHVDILTSNDIDIAKALTHGHRQSTKNYGEYDFIFNTAPDRVITPSVIDQLKSNVVIIDIASSPGGTDFEYCMTHGISARLCPGIPAKYAPETSAKIIFSEISKYIDSLSSDLS